MREPYNFQNIYLITTYRCNWECNFCLFRFNKEAEAPIETILDRLRYSIENSKKKVYLKITGGEPFLKLDLLEDILALVKKYKDKVYKIGIGSNGSIGLPEYFNSTPVRTSIFLSRHNKTDSYPTPLALSRAVSSPLIDFRINCNLIKDGIDDVDKIKRFIFRKYETSNITHFCFRELSKVSIDENLMYPKQISQYISYYKEHHVDPAPIENEFLKDPNVEFTRDTGNYYDINKWYWYKYGDVKLSVKFRSIDEVKLIKFNKQISPKKVDEYVIHPDGTLTGCWDKDLKIIKKGVV